MNVKKAMPRFAMVVMVGLILAGDGAETTQARGFSAGGGNNTQPTTQRPTER